MSTHFCGHFFDLWVLYGLLVLPYLCRACGCPGPVLHVWECLLEYSYQNWSIIDMSHPTCVGIFKKSSTSQRLTIQLLSNGSNWTKRLCVCMFPQNTCLLQTLLTHRTLWQHASLSKAQVQTEKQIWMLLRHKMAEAFENFIRMSTTLGYAKLISFFRLWHFFFRQCI